MDNNSEVISPNTKHIAEYLSESIQKLIDNANANENKLDNVFLKQATIPNLFFTAAFVSPQFFCLLKSSLLFMYTYILVMVTFFLTILATTLLSTIEKRISKANLEKSQNLYSKIKDSENVLDHLDKETREQINKNNQTTDNLSLIILYWIEDIVRIINICLIILLVIIGVYVYVN